MFFCEDDEFVKLGYFQIENKKTFSKYEAWQLATEIGLRKEDVEYIFNDNQIDLLDWTKEPEESIDQLYFKRARLLREKYDYLVLMYSGGSDSQVILDTCLRNDIKIDHIITLGNIKYCAQDAKINQEVFNTAIPYLDSVQDTLDRWGTKREYVDIGQLIIDQYKNDFFFDTFLHTGIGPLSSWNLASKSYLFKQARKDQMKLAESGKTIGYIWGVDKPNIFPIDGYYQFRFVDSAPDFACRQFVNHKLIGGALQNFYDEGFFVSREVPELTIKQCHLIVKELKNMRSNDTRLVNVEKVANTGPFIEHSTSSNFSNGKWLSKVDLQKIIYPTAPHEMFGNDKFGGSVMFTPRDEFFYRSKFPSRNRYVDKMKRLIREHEDYFKFNVEGTVINSFTVFGKAYKIDKI